MNLSFLLGLLVVLWSSSGMAASSKYKFRPINKGYNDQLQRYCANPQFVEAKAEKKIMHGVPVRKGKFPWAIVMKFLLDGEPASLCGGTIISSRHIITARHCFSNYPDNVTLMVGGVCYEKGENCENIDMRPVEIEFAAFEPKIEKDSATTEVRIKNYLHDMAIIQLKEDLRQFTGKEVFRDTRPACLPTLKDTLPRLMSVYGWGKTEKYAYGSRRLMEVKIPLLNATKDPLVQTEEYKKGEYEKICGNKNLYCQHSMEEGNLKDGAGGDSGTGIIGRRGHLAIVYGQTISGVSRWQLNIALRTQTLEQDICFYTGVCGEKKWLKKKIDKKNVGIKYTAFYDPKKPKLVFE